MLLYIGDTVYRWGRHWLVIGMFYDKTSVLLYDGDEVNFGNKEENDMSCIGRKNTQVFLEFFLDGRLCIWFDVSDTEYMDKLNVVLDFLEKQKIRIGKGVLSRFEKLNGQACIIVENGQVVFEQYPKSVVSFPYTKEFFMNDNELYDVGL